MDNVWQVAGREWPWRQNVDTEKLFFVEIHKFSNRESTDLYLKISIIVASLLVVSALHYFTGNVDLVWHAAHVFFRKLYFVPILAGAIWFGLRGAMATAIMASALYIAYVFSRPEWGSGEYANQMGEVFSFLVIGAVSGLLVDFQRKAYAIAEKIRQNSEAEKVAVAVGALSEALNARDRDTQEHCRRVAELASNFARYLKLPEESVSDLYLAGILHDIGKIGVRDDVLLKPDALSPAEFRAIMEHPRIAEKILAPVGFENVVRYIAVHHENWDGSGYPEGIAGTEIPLEGRILSISDTYDALREHRPYHEGIASHECKKIMTNMAGTKLDPSLLREFWGFERDTYSKKGR